MLSRILEPQTQSEMIATELQKVLEEPVDMKGKKMKASSGSEEVIERKIDEQMENELQVEVKEEKCIVCGRKLEAMSYICPVCKTKYCRVCSIMLSERHEPCWTCKSPLKF